MSVNHYENFPVASWLCPRAMRPAVAAIYWFARTADDLADEGSAAPAERLAALQSYRAALQARDPARGEWARVFQPLDAAIRQHDLPIHLLEDLLDAFEQDVRNPGYANREALLDYCRRSARPIGRLLLHLYGVNDAQSLARSDAVCSALQLINFWQDLGVDTARGRSYVPAEDAARHGLTPARLQACGDTPATRALVQDLCVWARDLMLRGAPLALRVPGRGGWELRLVVQGGLRILEKIERMEFATLTHRPALRPWDAPLLLWRAARMRAAPRPLESAA